MFLKAPVLKWYLLAALILVLDQITKTWFSANLEYARPWVINDFFNFTLLHNEGAAFSFLSDGGGWQRWFFSAIAALVSVVLLVWMARLDSAKRLEVTALSLVLGGALGNLIDRVQLGYVVDFIVVHYQSYYWPAFNVADSAICVGAVLLLIDGFRESGNKPD